LEIQNLQNEGDITYLHMDIESKFYQLDLGIEGEAIFDRDLLKLQLKG
jgi:hypothetical protein